MATMIRERASLLRYMYICVSRLYFIPYVLGRRERPTDLCEVLKFATMHSLHNLQHMDHISGRRQDTGHHNTHIIHVYEPYYDNKPPYCIPNCTLWCLVARYLKDAPTLDDIYCQ